MKMEKKQCAKCKHFLLVEFFRINKQTAQLISVVQNVWTTKKCANKTESVNLAGSKKFVVNAKEVKLVTATNEDQPVVLVVENRFARTIWNNQFVNKCGGGSICQNQEVRSKCRSCHRGSFCEHEKVRYLNIIVNGTSIIRYR